MIPEALFDAAMAYKREKLWRRLTDLELFAVRHADGQVSCCCVLGMAGEVTALAVYTGPAGIDSLRQLLMRRPDEGALETSERMHSQDCAMLFLDNKSELATRDLAEAEDYFRGHGLLPRGPKAYPHFVRYHPGYVAWYLEDAEDQQRLLDGLNAAQEVSRRLKAERLAPGAAGFVPVDLEGGASIPLLAMEDGGWRWERWTLPAASPAAWPSAALTDEMTRARLRRNRGKGTWAARTLRHIQPISDEGDNLPYDALTRPPFFPMALALMDVDNDQVLTISLAPDPEDWADALGGIFLDVASRAGLPRALMVSDDRTEALLRPLCAQLGVGLLRQERVPLMDEMLSGFAERFGGGNDDEEAEAAESILDLIQDPEALRAAPDELIELLLDMENASALPNELARFVHAEARRRGME